MQGTGYSTYEIRLRAVEAVQGGMSVSAVARAYRVDRSTVHRWASRFEAEGGNQGLLRKPVSGRPRKLYSLEEEELRWIVLSPATEFGFETDFWTSRRLHQVITTELDPDVSQRTILRRLREAGLTYQKPEREYLELDPEARQIWIEETLPDIKEAVKKYRAILYFEDEASISLRALLGKTWAPRGQTPKQRVTGKRGSVSAMSAITNGGKLLFKLYDKRIASAEVIHFLRQILNHHKRRHIVVVMDKAPPHISKKTRGFIDSQKRLHVFPLPSYSPDWNPDEKVWNHLKNQELQGHQARTTDELKKLANRKLRKMSKDKQLLKGLFYRCCVAELLA